MKINQINLAAIGSSTLRPWTSLRSISNSYAARSTILIPVIGYMILFNDRVIRYLDLVNEVGGPHHGAIPPRLVLVYFGLCSVAIGTVIYSLFCPSEAKRYETADEYVGDAAHTVPMIVRDAYERELMGSPFKGRLETIKGMNYIYEEYWRAFLYIYFEHLNLKHPLARTVIQIAYVIGFTCLAIPSAEVFWRVVKFSFGWT